jgi:cleavage and polyadenylation specificity factor subunit 1
VPELVTATGSGALGGFTLFQVCSRIPNPVTQLAAHNTRNFTIHISSAPKRDLPAPARTKRKLHVIGGARGLWSLSVRTAVKVNGVPYDRPANPYHAENDSLILRTDAIPSPGFSRVSISPLSLNTAIDLTRIRGSLGHAPPRGTLRSPLASRALPSVLHHSSKALLSYMCYQTPSECWSLVRYISLRALPRCK